MFSCIAGFIFFLGLIAHVSLTMRYVLTERSFGRTPSRATLAWNAPSGALLLWMSIWGPLGLIDGGVFAPLAPLVAVPAILAISQLVLRRDRIIARLRTLEPRLRHRAEWGLFLAYGLLSIAMIEAPWSWAFCLWGPSYWWLELILLSTLTGFFYLVGRRHGSAAVITWAAYAFIGIAQYFVRKFKNAAILPNDLLALGTAMAVSDQYTYSFDPRAILSFALTLLALAVLSLLHPSWTVQDDDPACGHVARDARNGLLSVLLCAFLVLVPNYMEVFRVEIMYWYSINFYEKQGFLPTFVAVLQDLPIHKPKDYETADAEAATRELSQAWRQGPEATEEHQALEAQFDEVKPTVVVVMNESFADLADFDGMHCDYPGPEFFNSVDDALFRGELFVDVHGGGTCNSEFEFLSGNSLGYIGAGKYPYSTFRLDDVDSMAAQFKRLGYHTIAMHPNYASNWNRHKVYPAWGFDEFLDIDAFGGFPERNVDGTKKMETPTGVPIFHSGVSDQATYEKTLACLAADDSPQFIFNVTMQNHGSYNQNNIPADKLTNYRPRGVYENPAFAETPERLNEYLSCIQESDRALEWFMAELRKLDRPVLLVFFGDHQPSMTPDYNDVWYLGEDDLTHSQRVYHAEYLVWANYDVVGNSQTSEVHDTSVDVLGTLALDAIGVPTTDYQAAQLAVHQKITAMNLYGYLGENGTWYDPKQDGPYRELYDQMALVEYLNFAERV